MIRDDNINSFKCNGNIGLQRFQYGIMSCRSVLDGMIDPIHNSPNDQIYFHDLIIQYSELCGVAALIDMVVYK